MTGTIPFVTTGAYPVRAGNRVQPLIDGAPAFRRICAALDQAQARVWVTVTFLWAGFQMPDGRGSFFEVLTRACRRGLDVRVLFWRPDHATAHLRTKAFWGSPAQMALLEQEASGIKVRWIHVTGGPAERRDRSPIMPLRTSRNRF